MAIRWPWMSEALRVTAMAVLVTAAPGLSPPCATSQTAVAGPTLEIGTPFELTLTAAQPDAPAATEFGFTAATDGPLTVEARSYDGVVVLQRLAEDGAPGAESDGGGIGWYARLVVQAQAGERVRMRAVFKQTLAGRVVLEVRADAWPLPEGHALAEATANWHFGCGEAAASRGESIQAAVQFHYAGQVFYQLGLFADCQRAYEACLPLAEAAQHGLLRAVAQGFLGGVALQFGDLSKARELLLSARDGAVSEKNTSVEMFCQSCLGEACVRLGDPAGARVAFDRAILIARSLQDTANESMLLSQSALLAAVEGDSDAARAQHARAIELADSVAQPDGWAQVVTDQGRFHAGRGELDDAARCFDEALGRAVLPAVRAAATGELGNVRLSQGRWPEARSLYAEVLETALELGDRGLEAAARENLGKIDYLLGDEVAAEQNLNAARELAEASTEPAARIRVLLDLAALRIDQERPAEARRLLEQAEVLTSDGAFPKLSLLVLAGQAVLDSRDPARWASGLEHADQLLELATQLDQVEAESLALNTKASLQSRVGHNAEAAATAARAVAVGRDASPRLLAAALTTQIDCALAARDLPTARQALADAGKLLSELPESGLESEAASLLRSTWTYAEFTQQEQDVIALAIGQTAGESAARAALVGEGFRAGCRAQGRALLEGIVEHRRGGRNAEAVALRHERKRLLADRLSAQAALGTARQRGVTQEDQQQLRERADACAAQAEAILEQLRQRAPQDAALHVPPEVEPERVQRELLSDGAILVQFAEGQERLYAYVLTGDAVEWHDLGARSHVESLVRELLAGMSDFADLAGPSQIAASGLAAWEVLLEPLLPAAGEGRLLIVPTPMLAALPFEALVTEAAPDADDFSDLRFVIDRYEVSYGPSTPVLCLLASAPARVGEPRLLALADPLAPGELSAGASAPRQIDPRASWPRLPGTRAEAIAIVDLLYDARPSTGRDEPRPVLGEGRGGKLLTAQADAYFGADASAARLSEAARRYSIVHFAAHGSIDASDPRRSGLVLSASGDDDGFLSVPEVLDLDLDADLVVLSACDTARGTVRRGEGVQSLARAFLHAGARGVVATLWQVDDHETELVMTSFYQGLLQDGLSVAAALRGARLELRNATARAGAFAGTGRGKLLPEAPERETSGSTVQADRSGHPYFWAPFIPIGYWN